MSALSEITRCGWVRASHAHPCPHDQHQPPARESSPVFVLVCGDNRILSGLVTRNLRQRGYAVRKIPLPPSRAIGTIDVGGADIVIVDLDCQEPELWRRAAELRASIRSVPLVILGHEWPTAVQVDQLHPCKYVRKPFAIEELVAAVQEVPLHVT